MFSQPEEPDEPCGAICDDRLYPYLTQEEKAKEGSRRPPFGTKKTLRDYAPLDDGKVS